MKADYSMDFQGVPKALEKARLSVSQYLHACTLLTNNQIIDTEIALGEVLQNIVRYGYSGGDSNKVIRIKIAQRDSLLIFEIKDFAEPILDLGFLTKSHAPSEFGKMGINLIKKIASIYTIDVETDGNLHTLVFI
jgi:anti-sigma regulatory factor (Ser/Thr protein kinase)